MIILKKNEKDMKNYLCAAALAMCLPVAVFSQPATDNPVSGKATKWHYQPTTEKFTLRTFVWNSLSGENSLVPLGDVAELTN